MAENAKTFKPTEELVETARAAMAEDASREFWEAVEDRLYAPEKAISPRQLIE